MQHISMDNFSSESIEKYIEQFASNHPFPHIIIDNFLKIETAEKIISSFNINKHWINYSLVNNFRKFGLTNKKYMDKNCIEVFEELSSKEFVNLIRKVSGMKNIFLDPTLDGGGIHQTFTGVSLNMHTDYRSHTINKSRRRVLNIIIFFNKNWLDEYNGELEFWDKKVKQKIKSITPIFNRCVIFKTDKISFHGHPTKLNLPPNMSRKSIAAYYFAKEEKNLKLYPTKYVGRPNDSYFYRFLIFVDTFLNSIFSFLKRRNIVNDKFASKMLDLFK